MKNFLKKIEIEHLYWIAIFIIIAFFHSFHNLNSDEGIILDGAWNLLNGKELYTEMVQYITPGSFYTLLIFWKIFGVHFWTAKLLAILFLFVGAIGVRKISYEIAKDKSSYLAPLLFVFSSFSWPLINHNTFNACFLIWSILFFIKGLKSYSIKDFALSGFISGIGIMFLQHKSGVILITSVLFLCALYLIEKNKKILKLTAVFISGSILPCLLLFHWPVDSFFKYLFAMGTKTYREYNPTPSSLFILVMSFFFITILILRKKKNKKTVFLIISQLILLALAFVQQPDFYHIFVILFPTFALIPLTLKEIKKQNKKIKTIYYSLSGIIILLIALLNTVTLLYFPPFSNQVKDTVEAVKENCNDGDYLYSGPFLPNLYFETRKINPSPYYVLTINTKDSLSGQDNIMIRQYKEVEKILKKTRPQCALQNFKIMERFNYEKNNPVDNFIEENYNVLDHFGNTILYKIKK